MSNQSFRLILAAAALLLGGQALAQAAAPRSPSPWDRARNPNTGQPAPTARTPPAPAAPAAQPVPPAAAQPTTAAQPSAATAQGAQLTPEFKKKLDELHARNQGRVEGAKLAEQQAQAPELKQLAKKVEQDHTRVDQELQKLSTARGGYTMAQPDASETQARTGTLTQLKSAQGADFDRQFTMAMIRDYDHDVNLLKGMRETMPGKDAEFKKWLDDTENVMEQHLTDFRNVKKTLDTQRQARTPAKR